MTDEQKSDVGGDDARAETARGKVGFFRRWIRRLFGLVLLVACLLAALPWILTHTAVGDAALAQISRQLPDGATVGGLTLSWTSPVGAHDVAFANGTGVDATVQNVATEQSMLWMLVNREPPQALTLSGVAIDIDLDAIEKKEKDVNVDEKPGSQRAFDMPKVVIEKATIRVANGPFRSPVVTDFEKLDITPGENGNARINGVGRLFADEANNGTPFQLTGEMNSRGQAGRFGFEAKAISAGQLLGALKEPPFYADGQVDLKLLVGRETLDQPWQLSSSLQSPTLTLQPLAADSRPLQVNQLTLSTGVEYDPATGDFFVSPFALESDLTRGEWTIRGNAAERLTGRLDGRLELLGPAVALANLPEQVELSSVRFDPLTAEIRDIGLALSGSIQWPECNAFGLRSDNGRVDYELTPEVLDVSLANVPVGSGRALGNYRFDLESTPPRLEFAGGPVLQQVALTETLCRDWLKYVSPTLANATNVRGEFGLALNPINTQLVSGELPDVSGQLLIASGSLQPGPLGLDIIGTVSSIGALAGSDAIRNRIGESNNLELMRLPTHQVDFAVQKSIVQHRGFTLVSGNVTMQTAGLVNLDDRIDITARLTVDPDAIRDKPILAGAFMQPIDIPVGGTIDAPKLDRSAFKNFGRDAAAGAIGGLLQKLLDRKNRK